MVEESGELQAYVLGIDLGARSVGWCCLKLDQEDKPVGVMACGVRVFEAGVEGDMEQGKDSSRAAERRAKRAMRRQIWRRAWRMRKVLRVLQRRGLLPMGSDRSPQEIHRLIGELDQQLKKQVVKPGERVGEHVWVYRLRAMALDQKLEPYALGRALYHLAQRRGFLSNRKARKKDEEEGKVKRGIQQLEGEIAVAGKRTLGEYLASLDPEQVRIRQRWTSRRMYQEEFEAIWRAQEKYHPELLKPEVKEELKEAIFYQRPLKSARWMVGWCELEPMRRRIRWAMPLAQRFRMLQRVNDLEVIEPDGQGRKLSEEERRKLIEALEREGDISFDRIRKLLGLKKTRKEKDPESGREKVVEWGHEFNLERGGEKKLPGDRTGSKLARIFGERWWAMSEEEREEIVRDVLEYEREEALVERAKTRWGLDDQKAKELAAVELERGYAPFSRRAMKRLLEHMEKGVPYATARKQEYPESSRAREPEAFLPPVLEVVRGLRNPAVCRALTELRKVVNGLIRRYGKPKLIRLELARDLRRSRGERERIWKSNREREEERKEAAERIRQAGLIPGEPSREDIEKWLLAEECNWMCPYTGKTITPETLLGPEPRFDVEHIVPLSVSLDNSFANKTLCEAEFNRHRKRGRLPMECFDPNSQEWHEVLQRVRRFQGVWATEKLKRFQWRREELGEDFTLRDLQDTRYASRLAAEYLGQLYGGVVDGEGRRRVQVSAGGVTAILRWQWGLDGLLGRGEKSREDHRHHAVDAVVIALTEPRTVKKLAEAAKRAEGLGRRGFVQMAEPWEGFRDEVEKAVKGIVVSHRPNHRVRGALHDETYYSPPCQRMVNGRLEDGWCRVRKPLEELSREEVEEIVDERIRELVKAKLNGKKPEEVFGGGKNLPVMVSRSGREIVIKRVRIWKKVATIPIGEGIRRRYAAPGSNHHIAMVAVLDESGREVRWEGYLVSRFEAMQRVREKKPVVQRNWGSGKKFLFSLSPGDYIRVEDKGQKRLLRVVSISRDQIECRLPEDARPAKVLRKTPGARIRFAPGRLYEVKAEKVVVTPLGEVFVAHD